MGRNAARAGSGSWFAHWAVVVTTTAFAVAASITLLELYYDLGRMQERLTELRAAYVPQLAQAAWELDEGRTAALMRGIVRFSPVVGARLRLTDGSVYEAGTPGRGERVESVSVDYLAGSTLLHAGILTLRLDDARFWRQAGLRWLIIVVILATAAGVGAVWGVSILRRQVAQPLDQLEQEIQRLGQGDWGRSVVSPAPDWSSMAAGLEALRRTALRLREAYLVQEQVLAQRDRVLDTLPFAIWLLDPLGYVRHANARARAIAPPGDLPLVESLPRSWRPVRAAIVAAVADPPASQWLERDMVVEGRRVRIGLGVGKDGGVVVAQGMEEGAYGSTAHCG